MRHVLLTLTLLLAAPLADATQFGNGPIQALDAPATVAGAPTGTAVRVDTDSLAANQAGDQVWLPGGNKPIPARVTRVVERPDGGLVWTARVPAAVGEQTATIVEKNGHVFGLIPQSDGPALRLETRHGQSRIVPDKPFAPPAGTDVLLPPEPTPAQRALRKRQESSKADGTPRIDVLVAYQPSLVEVWGSVAAVQARIAYLETITNQAYVDTGMDLEIRVVATHLLDFAANADNDDALYAITDPSSLAVKQEIDRVRAMYGADLVKLMRNFDRVNQTSCGVGWLGGYHGNPFVPGYGFSVTADLGFGGDGCGEWTFAHELGHNQGAHHDIETTGGDYGAFEYSRGHRQTISADSGFATIMAYNTGPQNRLGRFSDPDLVDCLGQPCGIADEADNARGIVETAALVAGLLPEASAGGLPTLSLDDVQIVEGNSGQRPVRFTLSLSRAAPGPVTVNLATRQASATVADFVSRSYSILIPAGQTAVTIDVGVRGDTLAEPDELFSLDILSASGAGIAKGQGVATIVSDDPLPVLSLQDVRVGEGDGDGTKAVFTAVLSKPSTQAVRFDIATGQYGGGNAAREYQDFTRTSQKGITIAPGQVAVQFFVPIVGDTTPEPDERFYVAVGGVVGASIDDVIIRAEIVDDDNGAQLPQLSLVDESIPEGNGGPRTVQVGFELSAPASHEISFGVITVPGTAEAPEDFEVGTTVVTVPAGRVSGDFGITITGDTRDEANETLGVLAYNLVGAVAGRLSADVTLVDDDGTANTPPMVARDDRAIVPENATAFEIDVLANDAINAARLAAGSVVISEGASTGTLAVDNRGTPANASDDVLRYTPPADWSGEVLGAYRACEGEGRCSEAAVVIAVRPHPGLVVDNPAGSGYVDIPISGMRALPDARIAATYPFLGEPISATLAVDPTPEYPWEMGRAGLQYWMYEPAFHQGINRLLADARALQAGDVDLYLGLDDNLDGIADPEEVRCASISSAPEESCEFGIDLGDYSTRIRPWVALHNRSASPIEVEAEFFLIGEEVENNYWAKATGPGHLEAGESFPVRLLWTIPFHDQGRRHASLVKIRAQPDADPVGVPVRFVRKTIEPGARVLAPTLPSPSLSLPAGVTYDKMYVDVPPHVTGLETTVYSDLPVDVHLVKADTPSGPHVPAAPALGNATLSQYGVSGRASMILEWPQLTPGRWYVVLANSAGVDQEVSVSVSFEGTTGQPFPSGSFFNPDRSGHGLFVYPAGDQLAGLWYTYLQDGSSAWYYLQGPQPVDGGIWIAELYRAAWNGSSNYLTDVGDVVATPDGQGGFTFSYFLDGESGAETLQPLGAGCPTLAGQPLDASSHWFDPAKAGTGYSVQLFPDYEFYAAFVYDSRGVPRFLTAEAGSFRGADATIPLEQLTGFCPLCERTGAPTRADIGTLRRRFNAAGLVQMQLDAIYTGGVPGAWTGNDTVQLLGGAGTTQGCPTP